MMEHIDKEVFFKEYCPKCKNEEVDENMKPCEECLSNPVNEHSHKPVKFEEKE